MRHSLQSCPGGGRGFESRRPLQKLASDRRKHKPVISDPRSAVLSLQRNTNEIARDASSRARHRFRNLLIGSSRRRRQPRRANTYDPAKVGVLDRFPSSVTGDVHWRHWRPAPSVSLTTARLRRPRRKRRPALVDARRRPHLASADDRCRTIHAAALTIPPTRAENGRSESAGVREWSSGHLSARQNLGRPCVLLGSQ